MLPKAFFFEEHQYFQSLTRREARIPEEKKDSEDNFSNINLLERKGSTGFRVKTEDLTNGNEISE